MQICIEHSLNPAKIFFVDFYFESDISNESQPETLFAVHCYHNHLMCGHIRVVFSHDFNRVFLFHQLLLHFVVLVIHCFSSLKLMNECAKPVASHSFIHSSHLISFVFLILLVNNCRPVYVIRVKGEKSCFI